MITAITTHNINIFKLFYQHRLHNILKENLLLYVDKENESEIEEFKDNYNFIDWENTDFFTKGFNKESLKILKI